MESIKSEYRRCIYLIIIVALIRSGSGTVVGTAYLADVILLTKEICIKNTRKIGMVKDEAVTCVGEFAWVMKDVVELKKPVRMNILQEQ